MKQLQTLLLGLVLLAFVGCGYKPSAKYARQSLGEKVSTFVIISKEDPENSVLIKDAIDTALIDTFHTSLTTKEKSDSHLVIKISTPSYAPIQYDENGFVVAYRMKVTLHITQYKDGHKKNYSASGSYDFAIEPNAIISDQQRFDAIRYAAQKAIVAYLAQVSSSGIKKEDHAD